MLSASVVLAGVPLERGGAGRILPSVSIGTCLVLTSRREALAWIFIFLKILFTDYLFALNVARTTATTTTAINLDWCE